MNKGWKGDIPSCCCSTTKAVDVGGADAFGITYYNTSGTYNTAVKSSSFVASSGNGWVKNSGSPSHGNGKLGVAFEFQDQARLLTACCDNFEFLGNNMSIVMTYDSNFSNFHGYARTFYTHTWDKAGITSINFGASSSSYGVNVVVSNTSYGWTIYNGSDATF